MVITKSKIVCSVNLCRLEFVSLPFADQPQPNFYKLPSLEQKITKVDWKSTIYSAIRCPWIFIFILFFVIFYLFLFFFIYTININPIRDGGGGGGQKGSPHQFFPSNFYKRRN